MDPSLLTVYTSPFPKKRIGREYDGGYVIVDIPNPTYSLLLAGGICSDISFEEEFITTYHTTCIALDGTIDRLPETTTTDIQFIKKNIHYMNDAEHTNLHDIIDQYEHIFVKMDIEGYEIPWIASLKEEHMNKFEQIVMEFHFPFSLNEGFIFYKLTQTHTLVHFHGNNNCGVRNYEGIIIPNVFECTYLHNKYFTSPPTLNKDTIPGILDMRNIFDYAEIGINYPPFVHNITEKQIANDEEVLEVSQEPCHSLKK
jgi:hypothetical protein